MNEQFDTTSNEAIQTLAGMYTNGTLTVPNLNLTGDLSVAGKIKCKTRVDSPIFNTGNFNMSEILFRTDNGVMTPTLFFSQNVDGNALMFLISGVGGDNNGCPYVKIATSANKVIYNWWRQEQGTQITN